MIKISKVMLGNGETKRIVRFEGSNNEPHEVYFDHNESDGVALLLMRAAFAVGEYKKENK